MFWSSKRKRKRDTVKGHKPNRRTTFLILIAVSIIAQFQVHKLDVEISDFQDEIRLQDLKALHMGNVLLHRGILFELNSSLVADDPGTQWYQKGIPINHTELLEIIFSFSNRGKYLRGDFYDYYYNPELTRRESNRTLWHYVSILALSAIILLDISSKRIWGT